MGNEVNIPFPSDFREFPDEVVHESFVVRFEDMVNRFPDRVAVTSNNTQMTYSELNKTANKIARDIIATRHDGQYIGFIAGHNLTSILAIWAILKAGKTYLALNPNFPADRLIGQLSEFNIQIVLASKQNKELTNVLHMKLPNLTLMDVENPISEENDNLGILIPPTVSPYVGITSGSTGKPKLIQHPTQGLMDQQRIKTVDFGLSPSDKWAVLNPLSFGGGNFSLYGALMNGSTACLYDIMAQGLQGIPDWIETEGVTIINVPPPVFRNIFSSVEPGRLFNSVRLIILAGDAMIRRDLELYAGHFSDDCRIVNMLALTETGIVSRYIMDKQFTGNGVIPVGFAFEGVNITLQGKDGQSTPLGEVGEIVVQSRYLLTDIPVRTGDLGRFRDGGEVEHLGRKDSMVKINGLRVEISEIESVLFDHPAIQNAVVLAKNRDGDDEPVLVAYIEFKPGQLASIKTLRSHVGIKLPNYMIPTRFIFLDKLPINTNGKIDKLILPEPQWEESLPLTQYIAPRDDVERVLVDIWSNMLKTKQIGINDDFFAIGGKSIDALQIMARVESIFGVKLPIQSLVVNPTISSFRKLIDAREATPEQSSIISLRQIGSSPAFFMIPGGARTAVSLMGLSMNIALGHKLYAFEYPGMGGFLEPMDKVSDLAAFFISKMKEVQPNGPYHLGGPCLGGVIVFEMAHQLRNNGDEVGLIALIDSTPPGVDYSEDMDANNRLNYLYERMINSIKNGNFLQLILTVFYRFKRNRLYLKLRYKYKHAQRLNSQTPQQKWLGHRLDEQSWNVFEKLQIAKKSYQSIPFFGNAIVILNSAAKGTVREKIWADLFSSTETYYIANTTHHNIFALERSQLEIAGIINAALEKYEQ